MIEKIYSTLDTFEEIILHKGLNILLADITKKSTGKDTRNGLGKTTFVEIIHFLFGGSCTNNSIFKMSMFKDHFFIMDYRINNTKLTVKRRGLDSNYVYVFCQKGSKYEIFWGKQEKKMRLADWTEFLGKELFNLETNDSIINQNIKFRTLFPYFARKAVDGGFLEASKYYKNQKVFSTQIALTYLLGLDTNLSINQKLLEDKKKEISDLKKVLKTDAYKEIVNEGINLDTEITILEEKMNEFKKELKDFHVHPKYREIELEASSYTKEISELSNKNFIDRQVIIELKEASNNEKNISNINIKDLYEEVKVKLPDALIKSFSDSKLFHEKLISNRKNYLSSELKKYESIVRERGETIDKLSIELSKKMDILNTHGALEQYSLLQTELNELINKINVYKDQQRLIFTIREEEANLKIEEQKLIIEITKSLEEHSRIKQKAILLVEETSKSLYDSVAQLNIGQTKKGRYDIAMFSRNQNSTGINSMLIYCFDMMMIQMTSYLGRHMDILIHDSALYDPVDERQIAEALRFARQKSLEKGFQYIVTLNSDDLPKNVVGEVKNNILSKVLTDSDESGSLLGVYF
ncbi:DUF2326 domain-containing protein [Bacillus safensis]|uniref:DUF2326 domain-containing protein n=1 Tax=Bacillus TaxID=1386 RepID=UPI00203CDCF0|nr:DUF2326 domain-containing protein [Bacillus safensis]MCM2987164.1 DUF2326 domain-containing protein [Bacillus safensis]MCY7447620.1 DUF2326 domain-containing protein [Bacillus safensis]MCY7458473.1 DUF2326 domain-containing protein [Bacillus safensis]MDP4566987.1 DUF2326 domain-containing protein [Bacillus safensis]MEC0923118.1 DUF2326 domain-containing protein [Bacillus safensis]